MSAAHHLESMGLSLRLADGGRFGLDGLNSLSLVDRESALTFARKNKPSILAELQEREMILPRPRRCLDCGLWQNVPGLAWWSGKCVETGEAKDIKAECTAYKTEKYLQ